jgi:hypothetical protein
MRQQGGEAHSQKREAGAGHGEAVDAPAYPSMEG